MEKEPRKASEVLLEIEHKLDQLMSIVRSQDQIIKILSNKLNTVISSLEKQATAAPPKIVVEAVNTTRAPTPVPISVPGPFSEREIPISAESRLPLEEAPSGFRRTSRPETFSGDDSYLQQTTKFPPQIPQMPAVGVQTPPPGRSVGEVVVPNKVSKKIDTAAIPKEAQPLDPGTAVLNAIPVSQRVVNSNGKSLFLADVEVVDLSSMKTIVKTRTNGTGKWNASLGVGNYRIFIRKLDSATKERLEVKQDITVDGQQSPLELSAVIIKTG